MEYQEINRKVMDERVRNGWRWALPFDHETFMDIVDRKSWFKLTPTKLVPFSWMPESLEGLRVLGLASGGGQQMPVFARLGARVMSVDISPEMLDNDRRVAEREGVELETLEFDITRPLPLEDDSFDIIFMPVCLCYISDISPIFREIHRVLKPDGVFLTGQDNGMNYLLDDEEKFTGHFPYDPLGDEKKMKECLEGGSGIQFSHTAVEIIRSMVKAGFLIQDLYEDTNGSGLLHERNVPSFVAIRSTKVELGAWEE